MRLETGVETVEEVLKAIFTLLESNTLLALSTFVDHEIWTATVFYAYDDKCNLFFISAPDTKHCQMIAKEKKVSGAIYPSDAQWGTDIQGLQFEAVAEQVKVPSVPAIGMKYLKRFPVAQKFISSPELFLSNKISSRLYRLTPNVMQIYDEVTFGEDEPIRRVIFD